MSSLPAPAMAPTPSLTPRSSSLGPLDPGTQAPSIRTASARPGDEAVLTPEALAFLADLARSFAPRIEALLKRRKDVQARLDAGGRLELLPDTLEVREASWTIAPLPPDLLDRRVEITGPVDRKMII